MPTPLVRPHAPPLCALAAALLSGCGGLAQAPMADINLSPAFLCEGSQAQTVTLSGKASQAADGSAEELEFAWETRPAPLRLVHGSKHQVEWVAEFDARSPIAVELVVTDAAGETATRSRILPLTRTTATPCSAGCLAHELCARVGGEERCVEADTCSGDDECGCLRCGVVDDGSRHCLAP